MKPIAIFTRLGAILVLFLAGVVILAVLSSGYRR
jgi:hypothetical protein